jgi:LPS-assembly lipoprotein
MSLSRRRFITVFAALAVGAATLLGGCGFQPLYKKHQSSDAVIDDLAQVEILNPIDPDRHDDRMGQHVKNLLLDRLNPKGRPHNPFYTLTLSIRTTKSELGLRITEEATRAKLSVEVDYTLSEKKTDAVLFRESARSVNSYNIIDSEFATLSAENNAKKRGAREVADLIKLQLGIFFERLRGGS